MEPLNLYPRNYAGLDTLVDDAALHIFIKLDLSDLLNLARTNKHFNRLASHNLLWLVKVKQLGMRLKLVQPLQAGEVKLKLLNKISCLSKKVKGYPLTPLNILDDVYPVLTYQGVKSIRRELNHQRVKDTVRLLSEIFTSRVLYRIDYSQIRVLQMGGANLCTFPTVLFWLNNLTHLYLENNYLTKLSKKIELLPNLEVLELRNNKIVELPQEILSLNKLTYLSLTNNKLRQLPENIERLERLESLYVAHNELTKIPQGILSLKHLKNIHLGGNSLSARCYWILRLKLLFNLKLL